MLMLAAAGPNEVSVSDPDVVELVHGPKSRCTKAAWYDMDYPKSSLVQMRDKSLHEKRRRDTWDKAFSAKGKPPSFSEIDPPP